MAIIYIHRQLPVIDGFVAVPPNYPRDNTTTDVDTYNRRTSNETVRLIPGGRFPQEFIREPAIRSDNSDCCT